MKYDSIGYSKSAEKYFNNRLGFGIMVYLQYTT